MKLFLICIILITNGFAHDIFEYTDKNGNLVMTNIPNVNAKKVDLPNVNIDYSLTSTKENTRKKILQEELDHEKIAYEDSKQMLEQVKLNKFKKEDERKQLKQIELLQNAVTEHKKNIEILTGTLN